MFFEKLPPWSISLIIHAVPILIILVPLINQNFEKSKSQKKVLSFEMMKSPIKKNPVTTLRTSKSQKKQTTSELKPIKKVFGTRRDSKTSQKQKAIDVKTGNTLLKQNENQELTQADPTSLPIPAQEFLITQMPTVVSKVKIIYPSKARDIGLEGRVVFNLLIDSKGKVREAILIEGLIDEMNVEAQKAIMKYQFSPAFVDGQPVAARIRFAVRFILEDS